MECCWNDKKHIRSAYEVVIFAIACFIGVIVASLLYQKDDVRYWIACGLLFVGTGAYLYLSVLCFLITMRKYSVSRKGIQIKYPLCRPIFYSWEEISDVSICNVHYTKKGPMRHEVVLRLVIGTEERGPKKGMGSWVTWGYEMRHLKKVITLGYNSQRLLQLEKLSPLGVNDYRHIKMYGSVAK